MLKQSLKGILELGAIYAVVVILLDSFLRGFSILLWMALCVTFLPFSVVILGGLVELVPKRAASNPHADYGYDDELSRLERLTESAVTHREEQAIRLLVQRITLVAGGIGAYTTNLQPAPLGEKPHVALNIVTDEQVADFIAGKVRTSKSLHDIEELLSKIESWSA